MIMFTVTRKASDSPVRVTTWEISIVSVGSLNSRALYRSVIQTAEFSPLHVHVYLCLYMGARLEFNISSVVSQGIDRVFPSLVGQNYTELQNQSCYFS